MAREVISEYRICVYDGGYGFDKYPYVCNSLNEVKAFVYDIFRNQQGGHFPCKMEISRTDKIFEIDNRKFKCYPHRLKYSIDDDLFYYNYSPVETTKYPETLRFIAMDQTLNLQNLMGYFVLRGNFGTLGRLIEPCPDIDSYKDPMDREKPISFVYEEHWGHIPGGARICRANWRFLDETKDVVVNVKTFEQIYGEKQLDFNSFFNPQTGLGRKV